MAKKILIWLLFAATTGILAGADHSVNQLAITGDRPYRVETAVTAGNDGAKCYLLIGSRDRDGRLYQQQQSALLAVPAGRTVLTQDYFPDAAATDLEVAVIPITGQLTIETATAQPIDLEALPEDPDRPEQECWVNVDYYDLLYYAPEIGWTDGGEAEIAALFTELKARKVTGVLWRISLLGQVLYRSQGASTMPPGNYPEEKLDAPLKRAVDIMRQIGPLAVAVREARRSGIKILIWVTVEDDANYEGGPWWSQFVLDHPECALLDRDGKPQWGTFCYSNPLALEYRLNQLKELLEYHADGIFYCFRFHGATREALDTGERYGYNPEFVAKYRERYGVDILAHPAAEGRVLYLDGRRWQEIKAEAYDTLIEHASALIHAAGQELVVDITSANHRYREGMFGAYAILNWDLWTRNHWVDHLVVGIWQQTPAEIFQQAGVLKKLLYPDQKFYYWLQLRNYGSNELYGLDSLRRQLQAAALAGSNGVALHEAFDLLQDRPYWQQLNAARQPETTGNR